MASEIPKNMRALVTQADKTAKVVEVPVPTIADDEVLVKVVALALNPTDWKHIKGIGNVDTIAGCDWSGHVIKTGAAVTGVAVGDHVAGFAHGGTYTDRGAFAEYLKASHDMLFKVPKDTLTHEQAAAMGCGYWTAVQALFHPTRLGLVEPPKKVEKEEWVLIYGGSGSVGMYAIQLAHLAGYKVVTTASPKNHELCKSLGADAVFDYRDPDAVSKIKALTKDSIRAGLDAISEQDTQKFAVQTFGAAGGKLVTILPSQEGLRSDVSIQMTLIYTSLGQAFVFAGTMPFPASPEDRAHMAQFLKKTPELVQTGKVRPNPTKLVEGGLEGVNAGLDVMLAGKHSGEKLVSHV